ncbi:serine O-acetyltransferase [Litorilituus lipolyticus]|uniref:Serine acetyltransferase n=1 Tax=Litorilituus lipolyticus TaxID=2491017 RepID=A0A502LA82_9GAMM|nr:serine acetyltransferase [Litorilituus lipolyticus]TPH18953.1 serine acetyltransferase [Litorilituus lipolyticus]
MGLTFFKYDLRQATKSTNFFQQLKWFALNHTLHLVFLIRLGQTLKSTPLVGVIFTFIIEYIIHLFYASDISLKAKLGKGLMIMHGHDIVIGADVVIGDNCKIFNGVTMGNKDITLTSKDNQPRIGNNVVLSTGAKILGAINIGDDVIVGANSVVIKDCEEGFTYVGIPARKIK